MLHRLKPALREFRVYRALRFAWNLAIDPVFRRDHVMRLRRPENLFQYRSVTLPNRYPGLFRFVSAQLKGVSEPRLLSFGCATGEEVFSLRAYFPQAQIKGVDINAGNIATCRDRLRAQGADSRIAFVCQGSAAGESPDSYDAVFCLAVFQNFALMNPKHRSCKAFIRFADFEREMTQIARCLKPGGLLALRYANFRFSDTECSRDFTVALRIEPQGEPHPRFDRDNQRLPSEYDSDVVFQKRASAGTGVDTA